MKMNQVSYFLALCEEKSFTRAAKRCGVKQPSITVAIKQLEHEFGGPLFERRNSIIRLTNLGNLVRPDLTRIDRSAANAKRKAAKFVAAHPTAGKPMEANMRVIAVTFATIAVLVMGLTLRPTPTATAALPAPARVQIDPYALQLTIDIKSLPEQQTGDPI